MSVYIFSMFFKPNDMEYKMDHDTDVMIVRTDSPQGEAKLNDILSEGYAVMCRFGFTVILEKARSTS